jgi:Gpi18-like mannosyltransferase
MDVAITPQAPVATSAQHPTDLPRRVALTDRAAWRDAAIAWLAQRIVFLLLTFLGWTLPIASAVEVPRGRWALFYVPWAHLMDAKLFADMAQGGYSQLFQAAYPPLFPLIEHTLAPLVGGHPSVAGLLFSNCACLGAFALTRVLVEREAGRDVARRTLLYLAIFPTSLFFAAAYTESLFLLVSVGAFLALRERRWALAGALAALATLTRQVGIVLLVPLAFEMARAWLARRPGRGEAARMLAALLAPPLALLGFTIYLWARFGTPFASAKAESVKWGRELSWPWYGVQHAMLAVIHGWGTYQVMPLIDLAIMLGAIVVTVALARSRTLPMTYILYACAMLAVVLVEPLQAPDWAALHSQPRYLVVIFPLFWFLASRQPRPAVRLAALACSGWLLAIFTLAWVNGTWIA